METIIKVHGNKGKKRSLETLKRMSESHLGQTPTFGHLGHKHSEEAKNRIRLANLGKQISEKTKLKMRKNNTHYWLGKKRYFSQETRQKIGLAITGEKHGAWKGNKVGYFALHSWIRRKLGKPDTCEHCGKTNLSGRLIHWANKSRKYYRDLTDWLRLCVRCHRAYDRGELVFK